MGIILNARFAALRYVTIALSGFALGIYYGENLSNKKYSSVLEKYVSVGNTKILNCMEIIYSRNANLKR